MQGKSAADAQRSRESAVPFLTVTSRQTGSNVPGRALFRGGCHDNRVSGTNAAHPAKCRGVRPGGIEDFAGANEHHGDRGLCAAIFDAGEAGCSRGGKSAERRESRVLSRAREARDAQELEYWSGCRYIQYLLDLCSNYLPIADALEPTTCVLFATALEQICCASSNLHRSGLRSGLEYPNPAEPDRSFGRVAPVITA